MRGGEIIKFTHLLCTSYQNKKKKINIRGFDGVKSGIVSNLICCKVLLRSR